MEHKDLYCGDAHRVSMHTVSMFGVTTILLFANHLLIALHWWSRRRLFYLIEALNV